MSDRLAELVLGLQRMAETARMRSDDLEYTQREERHELIHYLDQLLMMVDKLRASLLEDRKRLMPEERPAVQHRQDPIPKIVQQGPRKAEGQS
jgi:hypothetical protein